MEIQGSFVRYVSHEIRNPLNIIVMGLRHWANGIINRKSTAELMDLVADIEHANDNAVEILDNLLTFGKLSLNVLRVHMSSCSVKDLVRDSLRLFRLKVSLVFHICVTS